MIRKLIRASMWSIGLIIGLCAALLVPFERINPTVAVIVTLCAVVSWAAWKKGRWA